MSTQKYAYVDVNPVIVTADGKIVLGICNGFQVLIEAGLLPAFEGISEYPEATLATNIPIGYRCKWIYLRHENSGNCIFTKTLPKDKIIFIW